uniref:Death domain-containing protein n=1 Tax=Amphimedon queenslandica TaxID=400682 RepID=A0A1X7UFH8_AMPQE
MGSSSHLKDCYQEIQSAIDELAQLSDRLSGQTLQERVTAFVLRVAVLVGDLPENIDEFLCIIHKIDTQLAEKAAKDIVQSCAKRGQNLFKYAAVTGAKLTSSSPGLVNKSSCQEKLKDDEPASKLASRDHSPLQSIVYYFSIDRVILNRLVNDLAELLKLLKRHGYSGVTYYDLGLFLGLSPGTLDAIENSREDVSARLRECLKAWLQKADDVVESGGPTIYSLVSALKEKNHNAVADGIDMEGEFE